MEDLVWVGIRESEIKYSNFINKSLTLFGNNNSLQNLTKMRINHNNRNLFDYIDDYYNKSVINCIEKNPNTKFMYYSQIYSYYSMKKLGLLDRIVCLNNQDLIEFMNNKFKIKEYLKNYVPVLSHFYTNGNDTNFIEIKQKSAINDLVIQTEEGSGGFSTIVLNKKNIDSFNLNKHITYMITKYCKNNIPINIHILISKNEIILLPPSIQIIELQNNRLIYKGCDFVSYKTLVNADLDIKFKHYSYTIGELMQKKGYRGILGIDSIIYNDEIYFMEINPRFQDSSTILNKALLDNNLPSLQELNYNCFYSSKNIDIKPFEVNYSAYINEFGVNNKNLNIEPIDLLDIPNRDIEYENFSYLYTNLYNQNIYKRSLKNECI